MDKDGFLEFIRHADYVEAGSEAHSAMHELSERARRITDRINNSYRTKAEIAALMDELTGGKVGEGFTLFPPIYADCGYNLHIGTNVFVNSGCCFQDHAGVYIGDGSMIGHQVVFATLNHDPDPSKRQSMIPRPIRVGKNVWIGSHATVLQGVTIGDNAVIAAGAVVIKDVGANTVVAGVPARPVKRLDSETDTKR